MNGFLGVGRTPVETRMILGEKYMQEVMVPSMLPQYFRLGGNVRTEVDEHHHYIVDITCPERLYFATRLYSLIRRLK